MKTKKLLALLLSLCMASTLVFAACDDEESSAAEQSNSESVIVSNSDASESVEESSAPEQNNSSAPEQSSSSAPEQSESENSESNESSASEAPEPTGGMSETEWRAVFTAANFANVTVTDAESQVLFDGTKCSTTSGTMTMYLEESGGTLYVYMGTSGSYTKSPASSMGIPYTSINQMLPISVSDIANKYAEFEYIGGKYVSEDCTLAIENGKLVSCTNEEGTFSFSNYGTTSVTLPVVNSAPDVKGDGIISANEFRAALSASAFTNVKQTTTYYDAQTESQVTQTTWYDGSNIIKYYELTTGVATTQYYVKNDTTVTAYVSTPQTNDDYVIVNSSIDAWNGLYDNLSSCSKYIDFYAYFTFNGLTATLSVGTNALTLTFNENEQLISYSDTDNDLFITYSDYGTVSYSLPTNIYTPEA